MEWVAKITTVGLVMVLPGVAGRYLDQRWGTSFLGVAGLALGVVSGFWYLIQLTLVKKDEGPKADNGGDASK